MEHDQLGPGDGALQPVVVQSGRASPRARHGWPRARNSPNSTSRDRVYLDGELIEDTFDWYAQDIFGNVWYFGEISYELEDGVNVSLEGSWEAGVDDAKPGIVMPATPVVGTVLRQEFLLAEAEDMGQVESLDEAASVPYGDYAATVQTKEWTPLEPDVIEFKYYAAGVGMVLEENPEDEVRIELIEVVIN